MTNEELRVLLTKATPGPWRADDPNDQPCRAFFGCTPNGCSENHPRGKRISLDGPPESEYDAEGLSAHGQLLMFENEADALIIAALRNEAERLLSDSEALAQIRRREMDG